ncbi:MAG: ABC transporter ATPase [Flavobacteriales bacterium]|nr:MAG: ABC transporter ATPase [Flavobacteriales bacterium]
MNWKTLPPHSRVWIYQSNREFSDAEVNEINQKANEFVANWGSHGKELQAAIEVFHNRFVVVFVDEQHTSASGCSIDKSVHFMQQMEKDYGINLFDRMQVAYVDDEEIKTSHLNELKALSFEEGLGETPIFNNLVATKAEFETNWEVPLKDSWLADNVLSS